MTGGQVPQPSVHELARPARCAKRKVLAFNENGSQSTARSIERDPGAGDATADDDDVNEKKKNNNNPVSRPVPLLPRREIP